jgi:lysophospholipase L1-like esterase
MSNRAKLATAARNYHLVFTGDSLTAGTGASAAAARFPNVVANAPTRGRWFHNGGGGGDSSTTIKNRLLAYNADFLYGTQIIWAGRNNYSDPTTVKSDIAAMVAGLSHSRYLILSIINGDYAGEYLGGAEHGMITTLNTDLATLYGSRFVDVRAPLVALGAPGAAQENATDYGHDVPPSGARSDSIHLDDDGYDLVGDTVYAKLVALGW